MPLFEYRCPECAEQFELLVRNGEAARCPRCDSTRIEKLLSAASARVGAALPIAGQCPPPEAPPCGPGCCRLPS